MIHEFKTLDLNDEVAISACARIITVLRTHLDEAEFRRRLQIQAGEGYSIVYMEVNGEIVALAGCRVVNYMAWGRVFYIDDLVADPEQRRAGYGGALMDWLIDEARRRECAELHLDTGYQRQDAHRLYLRKGLLFSGHHMALKLA